ncbi:MAG TPA: hypothetical protein VLD64_05485 [Nitrosarchaeum sp.]|nr:hypothetical protein [Nitrosarchaeum sp.]
MKTLVISTVLLLMIGAVVNPIGFSYAEMSEQTQQNMTENNEENMSETTEKNITENTEQNMTGQAPVSDDFENFGTQVSAFVHDAMSQFQEQRQQTLSQIKQCREDIMNANPSDVAQVREDCRKNLDEIRDSYKEVRATFHDTFKEFRDNIKILQEDAKGHKHSDSDIQDAIKHIQEDAKAKHLKMQKLGQNATDVEHLKERMKSVHKHE